MFCSVRILYKFWKILALYTVYFLGLESANDTITKMFEKLLIESANRSKKKLKKFEIGLTDRTKKIRYNDILNR
jgi:hypothetical protein